VRANERLTDNRWRTARHRNSDGCLQGLNRENRWNLSRQRLPVAHFCDLLQLAPQLIEQLADVAIVRVAQARAIRNRRMSVMVVRAASVRVCVRRTTGVGMLMGGRQLVQAVAQQRDAAIQRHQAKNQQVSAGTSHRSSPIAERMQMQSICRL
jgi:hypothetical protein